MITNKDGNEKQDCGQNARWLAAHAGEYRWLKATLWGTSCFPETIFAARFCPKG